MLIDVGCISAPISMHRSNIVNEYLYLYRFSTGGYILFNAHRKGAFSLEYNSKSNSMLGSTSLLFHQSENLTSEDMLKLIEYFSAIDAIQSPNIESKFHHT
mgnify:CR=1 FL=1